jgi:hypothetical protein
MKRFNPVKHLYTNEVYMRESDEGLYVLFQGASDLELVLRQRIERQQTTIHMLENKNDKLEAFVRWIANDYVESSHDKVRLQRDDYIKRAKQLLNEL